MRNIYSVATGRFNPLFKKSRKAVEYISKMDGIVGVNVVRDGRTLVFFNTLNDAKIARNKMRSAGIQAGDNIMRCETDEKLSSVTVVEVADC